MRRYTLAEVTEASILRSHATEALYVGPKLAVVAYSADAQRLAGGHYEPGRPIPRGVGYPLAVAAVEEAYETGAAAAVTFGAGTSRLRIVAHPVYRGDDDSRPAGVFSESMRDDGRLILHPGLDAASVSRCPVHARIGPASPARDPRTERTVPGSLVTTKYLSGELSATDAAALLEVRLATRDAVVDAIRPLLGRLRGPLAALAAVNWVPPL